MSSSDGPWADYAKSASPASPSAAGPWDDYAPVKVPSSATSLRQAPENTTNILDDALHHVTGGLIDKLDAAAQAAGLPGGVSGDSFFDRYHKNLANLRANYEDFENVHPYQAKLAHAAGDIAPMLVAGPEAAAGRTMLGASLRSAGTGALFGGAYGLGSTNDESLNSDLKAIGLGAGLGAGIGGALPLTTSLATAPFRAAGRVAGAVIRPQAAAESAAGRVLNDAAGDGTLAFQDAPLPGMKPTLGQVTKNPGLQWLENTIQQRSQEGRNLAAQSQTASNSAINDAIAQLGDLNTDAPTAMSAALEKAVAARKAQNRASWAKAGIDDATGIPTQPLKDAIGDWYGGLTKSDRAAVPGSLFEPMSKFEPQESLAEIQSLRSRIGSEINKAYRSGDNNTARILGGADKKLEDFLDNLPDAGSGSTLNSNPDVMANYNAARADTRDLKQTFSEPTPIKTALSPKEFGQNAVSNTANLFIKPQTSAGAAEAFNSYLKAVNGDPAGLDAAKDAFAQKFMSAIQNSSKDAAGTNNVSQAKVKNFVGSYSHVINSPLFSQPQRDLIRNIADAADMSAATANAKPLGSDTFAKLSGERFLDALIGPGASKLIKNAGTVVGAGIGLHSGGVVEGAVGAFGGEKGGQLMERLLSAPRDRAMDLVTEAMHDPNLAKALMMKASKTNLNLIQPPVRAKILGILGADASQQMENNSAGN